MTNSLENIYLVAGVKTTGVILVMWSLNFLLNVELGSITFKAIGEIAGCREHFSCFGIFLIKTRFIRWLVSFKGTIWIFWCTSATLWMEEIAVCEKIVGKYHINYVVVSKTIHKVISRFRQTRAMFKNAAVRDSRFQIATKAPNFVFEITGFYYRCKRIFFSQLFLRRVLVAVVYAGRESSNRPSFLHCSLRNLEN